MRSLRISYLSELQAFDNIIITYQLMSQPMIALQMLKEFTSSGARYNTLMLQASEIYVIERFVLQNFPRDKAIKIMEEKLQNSLYTIAQQNFTSWGHFEYKTFVWASICYGAMKSKDPNQFDNEDLQFLNALFPEKSKEFLLFHLKGLSSRTSCKKGWTEEENELLTSVMRDCDSKTQWREVSFLLFVRSGCSIYKPRQKCREQWVNHLDPNLNRSKWTTQEDILLFQSVVQHGKKWSQISKCFRGRTEHMIKNRYNSILQKRKRKSHKVSGMGFQKKLLKELKSSQNQKNTPEPVKATLPEVEMSFTEEVEPMRELFKPNVDNTILEPILQQDDNLKLFKGWSFHSQQLQDFSFLEDNCFCIKENDLLFPFQL